MWACPTRTYWMLLCHLLFITYYLFAKISLSKSWIYTKMWRRARRLAETRLKPDIVAQHSDLENGLKVPFKNKICIWQKTWIFITASNVHHLKIEYLTKDCPFHYSATPHKLPNVHRGRSHLPLDLVRVTFFNNVTSSDSE
jgi:hypothetical protein